MKLPERTDQPVQRGDKVFHRLTKRSGKVLCSTWLHTGLVVPARRMLVLWDDAKDCDYPMPSDVACVGRVERDGVVVWDESQPVADEVAVASG